MTNKAINNDNYDLILEHKEKELKKQKRNKIILASSLSSLLVLGSTAVVAPIVSVAVNNANKIPNTLTFANSDITTLIDGYRYEIQNRKLTLEEFQNDLENITKKYIVGSNIKIGTIVQSVTSDYDNNTKEINIIITLEENGKREYFKGDNLNEITLDANILTIKKSVNEIGQFFTPIEIDNSKLIELTNYLKDEIWIKEADEEELNQYLQENYIKEKIKGILGINKDLIINIKCESSKVIINPESAYKFVSNENTDLIVNGKIELNVRLFTIIRFINLNNLFNKLKQFINNNKIVQKDFEAYLKIPENQETMRNFIYDNLESNKNTQYFKKEDIISIKYYLNIDQLGINFNEDNKQKFIWYELEKETPSNIFLDDIELCIDDLFNNNNNNL